MNGGNLMQNKLIWTAKFRMKQVKAFWKLCGYNLRHKLNMEGDDGFYYHLQRELMKDILHADLQTEYLAEHGLLPEEPEPEPAPEAASEAIRVLGMMELILSALAYEGATYMATDMEEYEDHICLNISKVVDGEITEYSFSLPHKVGEQYTDFSVDGVDLRFDNEALRVLKR